MGVDKHTIRHQVRAKRRVLPADVVRAASAVVCRHAAGLPAYRAAASVTAYVGSENEIATGDLLDDAAASGRPLFLPRLLEHPALVRWLPEQPLVPGRFGVLEPASETPEAPPAPAIAFLPVVAWDRSGTRLGRGGGFYDRLLARLRPLPLCVGLAYEFQEIAELPRDPWDVPVQFVITENGIIRCAAADARYFSENGDRQ